MVSMLYTFTILAMPSVNLMAVLAGCQQPAARGVLGGCSSRMGTGDCWGDLNTASSTEMEREGWFGDPNPC